MGRFSDIGPAEYIAFISTLIATVALFIAIKTLKNDVKQRVNSDIFNFLTRCSEEQAKYETDEFRRNAHSIFLGRGPINSSLLEHASYGHNLTICQNYLGDRLNLIFQAWVISGQNHSMTGVLSGWNDVTYRVVRSIVLMDESDKAHSTDLYPKYYVDACTSTTKYITSETFFPHDFVLMLENVCNLRRENSNKYVPLTSCVTTS